MFELGKVVVWFFSPLSLALVLWVLALSLFWRGRLKLGLFAGVLGVLQLWIFATPVMSLELVHHLERRYPALMVDQVPQADAILVLGGALSGANPPERPTFSLESSADRVWFAAELYRAGKSPWVLVSGGNQPGTEEMQVEADAIRTMLLTLGVPDSAIRLEGNSRNTRENVRESLALIKSVDAKRVLLVTSALHMPRALHAFQVDLRGSGLIIVPASTDVEGVPDKLHIIGRWLPDASSLALSSRALKEYLGLSVLFFEDVVWH